MQYKILNFFRKDSRGRRGGHGERKKPGKIPTEKGHWARAGFSWSFGRWEPYLEGKLKTPRRGQKDENPGDIRGKAPSPVLAPSGTDFLEKAAILGC